MRVGTQYEANGLWDSSQVVVTATANCYLHFVACCLAIQDSFYNMQISSYIAIGVQSWVMVG